MSAHSETRGQGPHVRRWYATVNNFTEEDVVALRSSPHKELVIGREEAPSTGTPHLHVYIAFDKQEYVTYCQSIVKAHWEPAKSRESCIEYCTKCGDILVDEQIHRKTKDLDLAVECMLSQGDAGCAREWPAIWVRHSRGLRDLQQTLLTSRQKPEPRVSWFYGTTGTGKTHNAMAGLDQDNIFIVSAPAKGGTLWFDGYCGQPRVVFDDFRPWWCRFDYLLRLLDKWPVRVQVKGGFVNFIPEEIIITTPKSVKDTFTGEYRTDEELRQLERRIHRRVHFVTLSGMQSEINLPNEELYVYQCGAVDQPEVSLPSGIPPFECGTVQLSQQASLVQMDTVKSGDPEVFAPQSVGDWQSSTM